MTAQFYHTVKDSENLRDLQIKKCSELSNKILTNYKMNGEFSQEEYIYTYQVNSDNEIIQIHKDEKLRQRLVFYENSKTMFHVFYKNRLEEASKITTNGLTIFCSLNSKSLSLFCSLKFKQKLKLDQLNITSFDDLRNYLSKDTIDKDLKSKKILTSEEKFYSSILDNNDDIQWILNQMNFRLYEPKFIVWSIALYTALLWLNKQLVNKELNVAYKFYLKYCPEKGEDLFVSYLIDADPEIPDLNSINDNDKGYACIEINNRYYDGFIIHKNKLFIFPGSILKYVKKVGYVYYYTLLSNSLHLINLERNKMKALNVTKSTNNLGGYEYVKWGDCDFKVDKVILANLKVNHLVLSKEFNEEKLKLLKEALIPKENSKKISKVVEIIDIGPYLTENDAFKKIWGDPKNTNAFEKIHFSLSNNRLSDIYSFFKTSETDENIKSLDLSGNDLGSNDADFIKLMEELGKIGIIKLNLSGNSINKLNQIDAVCKLVSNSPKLTSLDLTNNGIEQCPTCLEMLSKSLDDNKNKNMKLILGVFTNEKELHKKIVYLKV